METSKRVVSHEHPDTLASMNNLALTYHRQGRWKEAEELGEQVLESRKRMLGHEHPDTLALRRGSFRTATDVDGYEGDFRA